MSDTPSCACLKVEYSPEKVEFENPVTGKPIEGNRDRWLCSLCGAEFNRSLWHNAVVKQQQDEIERVTTEVSRYRQALNIIAGHEQCLDNLMSNMDVAIAALEDEPKMVSYPVSGRTSHD